MTAISVMPYVIRREIAQITPDLYIDRAVLTFLFICWIVVSSLLYRTFVAITKRKS